MAVLLAVVAALSAWSQQPARAAGADPAITATAGAGGSVTIADTTTPADCTGLSCPTTATGDVMSLIATPNGGFRFAGWTSGSCVGMGASCGFSVGASDETDNASFVAIDTITAAAGSGGSVAIVDHTNAGFCSGLTCTANAGDSIAITATPNSGFGFSSWTGAGCAGKGASCSFTASGSETDTATFVATVTVSAATVGSGSATVSATGCSAQPSCTVASGASVTVTAAATAGNLFTGWSGGTCAGTTNPCTFAAGTTQTNTAHFVAAVTISAVRAGSGTVSVTDTTTPSVCSAQASCLVPTGDSMSIAESATAGSVFTGWTGGTCTGRASPCTFAAATTQTNTAHFVAAVTITAAASGNGTATVTDTTNAGLGCTGLASCLVPIGDTVSLLASPFGGSRLTGWSGGSCTGVVNPCTFPAATTQTDTASFDNHVTISAASGGNGTATVTDASAGCFAQASCLGAVGDVVMLTATPAAGYHLTSWSGGSCVGATNPCTFTAAASEVDTASFSSRYTITVVGAPHGSVTIADSNPSAICTQSNCSVEPGDTVTLTAAATPPFALAGWFGGSCSGVSSTCTIANVHADETDNASFALPVPGSTSNAVFVSASGNDASSGTESQPVRTPQRGLAIVEASGGAKGQLRIAQGSYDSISLTVRDKGVGIYGGFDPSTWIVTAAGATTISGAPAALAARGATGVTLQDVTLAARPPSPHSPSAYGVVALAKSSLTLSEVAVQVADGLPGAAGAKGKAGSPGGAGGPGGAGETPAQVAACAAAGQSNCTTADGRGGLAGLSRNGNNYFVRLNRTYLSNPILRARVLAAPIPSRKASPGDGGFGGWGSTRSTLTLQGCTGSGATLACGPERAVGVGRALIGYFYGGWGSPSLHATPIAREGAGGPPGAPTTTSVGPPGTNGTVGTNGTTGAPGTVGANSSKQGVAWVGASGHDGHAGAPGAGGGGGGGGAGNTVTTRAGVRFGSGNGGGGGGGGGAGGQGGQGGRAGGGSFGIYVRGSSTVTVQDGSSITVGNGGDGGNGGPGALGGRAGAGGAGGSVGVPGEGRGGNGAHGGSGGGGGGGGGGTGGPSLSSYKADASSSVQLASGTSLHPGAFGHAGHRGRDGVTPAFVRHTRSGCAGTCASGRASR